MVVTTAPACKVEAMPRALSLSILLLSGLAACSGDGTGTETETEAELKAKAQAISTAGQSRAQKIANPLNAQARETLADSAKDSAKPADGKGAVAATQ